MKKKQFLLVISFLVIEAVLYSLILSVGGDINKFVSFSAILVAFIFSLLFTSYSGVKNFTRVALLFTVLADVCLVLMDPQNRLLAMIFFSITQLCYFYRLLFYSMSLKEKRTHIKLRALLIMVVLSVTLLVLGDKADMLSFVSMFYYVNLVLNVIFSIVQYRVNIYFTVGLICFLICDTLIGLNVANGVYFTISENSFLMELIHNPVNIPWAFYVPAQVLITLSLKVNRKVTVKVEEK